MRIPESLDYTDEQLTEMFTWLHFPGFTADRCGKCQKTANVGMGPGWTCLCGHFNVLSISSCSKPHANPDYGPSRERICLAASKAERRNEIAIKIRDLQARQCLIAQTNDWQMNHFISHLIKINHAEGNTAIVLTEDGKLLTYPSDRLLETLEKEYRDIKLATTKELNNFRQLMIDSAEQKLTEFDFLC